jgi:transglutaminase-like putative cysteine protease
MLLNPRPTSTLPTLPMIQVGDRQHPQHRTVRPISVYALHGLVSQGDRLLTLDMIRGTVAEVDPKTDNTTVLNAHHVEAFVEAMGLAVWDDTAWFVHGHDVYRCSLQTWKPERFMTLPYRVEGIAVWQSTLYLTSQSAGDIMIYDATMKRRITSFPAPGIGAENITIYGEELWICDRDEQTVYCMDRATGELQFSVLTPYDSPTAIAFHTDAATQDTVCYVAYASEEPYIRDDPNSPEPHQLAFRDRTFIHPLHIYYNPEQRYALSNGYLIEMFYTEEISALEHTRLTNLEWRIALPADTARQTVRHVEPIGLPFTEEMQNGQRVAVFHFDTFESHEVHIFGWKALIEVRGIKYRFAPRDVEDVPPLSQEMQDRYLIDDDDLAMETSTMQRAAADAIGSETNLLRQVLSIRNHVYDRLSYGIKPHIDTPDVAWERGVGSCGEYVGILLALFRLNGIACRTVGRYKCPQPCDRQNVPLQPDFNHVWIEFFIPGYGWVPMESNVDDTIEGGPYPTRFFMSLPWYHAEISKGIPFERIKAPDLPEELKIGQLAINHVRFTILGELPPPGDC